MKKMTKTLAAKQIREAAHVWEQDHLVNFKDDPEMIAVGKSDAADLEKLATIVEKGELTRACNVMQQLDTIVRETVPNDVYNWLCDKAED